MSLALFRVVATEFAAVSDANVNAMLAIAQAQHTSSGTVWGNMYATAMAYYTAHLMRLDPGYGSGASSAAGGTLTSQSDGDLSRGWSKPSKTVNATDEWLSETTYGRAYLGLRNSRAGVSPFATGLAVL